MFHVEHYINIYCIFGIILNNNYIINHLKLNTMSEKMKIFIIVLLAFVVWDLIGRHLVHKTLGHFDSTFEAGYDNSIED